MAYMTEQERLEREATCLLAKAGYRPDGRRQQDAGHEVKLVFCGAPMTRSTRKPPRTMKAR